MAIKVWLDAGHGGKDPGACANGLVEKQMTLIMALEAKKVLEAHGVIVGMSRTTDVYVDLDVRCDQANKWGANYFVSIHENAGGGDGAEAIHSIYLGKGEQLAKDVLQAINAHTGQNLRRAYARQGSNGDYYAVIRQTKMPAIIVECAFLDSMDYTIVDTIPEQQQMGVAIAAGILKHIGIPFVPMAAPTKPTGTTTAVKGYRIVVGSYADKANAEQQQAKLKKAGFDSFLLPY